MSCIKVLQSFDAVMDIHCIVSAALMTTMPPNDSYEYDLTELSDKLIVLLYHSRNLANYFISVVMPGPRPR